MANASATPRLRVRARQRNPLFISHVSISGLFGQIDYKKISVNSVESKSNINIIYGDNGSGKTTILNLIYACLSSEPRVGLRTLISKTPFKRFDINFTDGQSISVEKTAGLMGTYTYTVLRNGNTECVEIKANSEGEVKTQDNATRLEYLIDSFNLDVLFVDHERYVKSTYRFLDDVTRTAQEASWIEYAEVGGRRVVRGVPKQFPLSGIVDAVNRKFSVDAFQQGNVGEIDASKVYLEIAKALLRPKKRGPSTESKRPLQDTLDDLAVRAESYEKHGLVPKYPFTELKSAFETAPRSKKISINDALTPFVTSIERRLNALDHLHTLITNYETELNRYLGSKNAVVHVVTGLKIEDNNGVIDLENLSSGEKQMIFLLSASVISRGTRSLILIDEPELSLNYKWQRIISNSLAVLSSPQSTQFIMASHSIEVISRYEGSAVELINDHSQTKS